MVPQLKNWNGRNRLRNKAVRPQREDGYTNLMNKYGTSKDSSEAYTFERESLVPDMHLAELYEGNGLFSKIIDTPAEEALKHGFDLNLKNDELVTFTEDALDELDWEAKAATAIKWARLYGGSIIVMLIDDGKGLEEAVSWENIRSIDELRVFERAVVQPDYNSLYMQDFGDDGKKNRVSRFGEPEFYYVSSIYGNFKVHESRCLTFKNGVLPEQISNTNYQMWGMPEYVRIKQALRETITAHSNAVKMLERSVQAIYSMKNLAQLLATDEGENQVLKRLEIIDMARGLLNSVAIDAEGENYDFRTFQFSGVRDVIESTSNMLSALTNIPQALLFGRSPSGMNATGESDLENYYNFVERIQKLMLKRNLRYLLDIIYQAGLKSGELTEKPDYKIVFNPLWSLSETEQAAVEQTRAATALAKAQTAQVYVGMQAIDPSEVRHKLASDEDFNVEDVVEEDDEDLYKSLYGEEENAQPGFSPEGNNGEMAPLAGNEMGDNAAENVPMIQKDAIEPTTVGVLLLHDGKVLMGVRTSDFHQYEMCGPGGHIENGEMPEEAAIRETQEEFGITPKNLTKIGVIHGLPKEYGIPMCFFATDYEGDAKCSDKKEMVAPQLIDLSTVINAAQIGSEDYFLPFRESIKLLSKFLSENALTTGSNNATIYVEGTSKDGGLGSGNYGHKGRKGKIGGSARGSTLSDIKNSGSKAKKDGVLKDCSGKAQKLYDAAKNKEKEITPVLAKIVGRNGGRLTGLKWSIKTGSSLSRKISDEMKKSPDEYPTDEAALKAMKDVVRYTMKTGYKDFVKSAIKTESDLQHKGYKFIQRKNKYLDDDPVYVGVHSYFKTPEGLIFELQFHTPQSLAVKNKNHFLYEKERLADTPEDEKIVLRRQMKENTKRILRPTGIEALLNFKTEDE